MVFKAKSTTPAKDGVFRAQQQQQTAICRARVTGGLQIVGVSLFICLLFWRSWSLQEPLSFNLSTNVRSSSKRGWSWEGIKPSEHLIWSKCYDNLECSRLVVPLDWLKPSDGRKVVLAIVRKNATDRTNYLGPIFVNPGGPGGSGVEWVIDGGKALQVAAGENHDIISWDPRGVGATTPSGHCWSNPQEEQIWEMGKLGLVDSHPDMLYDIYARVSSLNAQCERNMGELTKYAGTTSVARDMLAISEGLGLEKIRYWGQSYGTVLGGTFAATFPDKVERMVLDGNVNLDEWYNGTSIHFTDSTDSVMLAFFDFCYAAGPAKCAFYAPSPAAIQARLDSLYARLRKHPIMVLPDFVNNTIEFSIPRPEIITYSDVNYMVIYALYQPRLFWPKEAQILSELDKGNGVPFLEYAIQRGHRQPPFSCSCDLKSQDSSNCPSTYPLDAIGNADTDRLVHCSEAPRDPIYHSLASLSSYLSNLKSKSPLSYSTMFENRVSCAGWKSRNTWRFEGPWHVNTAHPILLIGNTFDNITPLTSAVHNAGYFANSSVLVQNSYGHCSLGTPSRCTMEARRRYFQTGETPRNGTVCQPEVVPFGDEMDEMSVEDKLDKAMLDLVDLAKGF
ncbi:TAP-like protein-domain-containing protein [Cadophora sp. MPI-SDFR-AT-0126]|nr:TAP-like protein-domain-containing protein [Leotiomycetes sp. MPI-SDFR-AT-0126]